jgi:hypothetical protein
MVHGFLARLKAKEGDVLTQVRPSPSYLPPPRLSLTRCRRPPPSDVSLTQVRPSPAFQAPMCKTALIEALISALI